MHPNGSLFSIFFIYLFAKNLASKIKKKPILYISCFIFPLCPYLQQPQSPIKLVIETPGSRLLHAMNNQVKTKANKEKGMKTG
uniref:Uncharacterized protein n=1 Tax=Oryza brachyantha TaxID=4533 RepID=J3LWN2_ORYBR